MHRRKIHMQQRGLAECKPPLLLNQFTTPNGLCRRYSLSRAPPLFGNTDSAVSALRLVDSSRIKYKSVGFRNLVIHNYRPFGASFYTNAAFKALFFIYFVSHADLLYIQRLYGISLLIVTFVLPPVNPVCSLPFFFW
jgi:hypothetical protein